MLTALDAVQHLPASIAQVTNGDRLHCVISSPVRHVMAADYQQSKCTICSTGSRLAGLKSVPLV